MQEIEIESLEMMSFANANNNEGGGQRKSSGEEKGEGGRVAEVWFVETLAVFTPVFRHFPPHNNSE